MAATVSTSTRPSSSSSPAAFSPSGFSYCPSGARSPFTRIVVPDNTELKSPTQPKKKAVPGQTSDRLMRTALMNSIVKGGILWKIYAEKALELLNQPLPPQNRRLSESKLPRSRLSTMSES